MFKTKEHWRAVDVDDAGVSQDSTVHLKEDRKEAGAQILFSTIHDEDLIKHVANQIDENPYTTSIS